MKGIFQDNVGLSFDLSLFEYIDFFFLLQDIYPHGQNPFFPQDLQ